MDGWKGRQNLPKGSGVLVRVHSFDARSVLVKQERTMSNGTECWGGKAGRGGWERNVDEST